jgi:membrane-associated protein
MAFFLDLAAVNIFDARSVLAAFGVAGIFVVLFAETGLLVGFFLPGDSLLFTAGLLSSTAVAQPLPLPLVLLAAVTGALLGAQVGYLIGRRTGPALTNQNRRPKIADAMARSRHLLDRYGQGRAIVLARFVPVVRTVLNPVAGALGVPARVFALWQVIGGLLWTVGLVAAGFLLGRSVPGIDQYLLPVIALIVVISLMPLAVELVRSRRAHCGPRPSRVLLVDLDADRRARLAELLDHAADLEVVGTTSNAAMTRALLDTTVAAMPDAVLVALDVPHDESVETIATIHVCYPEIGLWTYAEDRRHPLAARALAAGAAGVIPEETLLLQDVRSKLRAG